MSTTLTAVPSAAAAPAADVFAPCLLLQSACCGYAGSDS